MRVLRSGDLLARIGGDEFVALINCLPPGYPDADNHIIASLSSEILNRPFIVGGTEIRVGLSCGLAVFPQMADNRGELLRLADQGMYEMKKRSKAAASAPSVPGVDNMHAPLNETRVGSA